MRGRRVASMDELFDAVEAREGGVYFKSRVKAQGESFTMWRHTCPGCFGLSTLSYDTRKGRVHEVDEHDDGTISVQPKPGNSNSILHSCGWHGYVDHDEWTVV